MDTTACITTYIRRDCLERLRDSIRQYYPSLPIAIEETGGNLSRARNRLLERARTKYVAILEDDFIFTRETNLQLLLEALESDEEIICAGGAVRIEGRYRHWCSDLEMHDNALVHVRSRVNRRLTPSGTIYRPCMALLNFFVARRDVLLDVKWDEHLAMAEHTEFFWRLSLRGRRRSCALVDGVAIEHDKTSMYRETYAPLRRAAGIKYVERQKQILGVNEIVYGPRTPRQLLGADSAAYPNIVILTIGHTGSSLLVEQLRRLGWQTGETRPPFNELLEMHEVNRSLRAGKPFDVDRARAAIDSLPQPWIVKDPKLTQHLHRWIDVFAPYRPLLLWQTKDVRLVDASMKRSGFFRNPQRLTEEAERQFLQWPWAKIKIDNAQIAAACQLFDPERAGLNSLE